MNGDHPRAPDVEAVRAAIGGVPRVVYEAAHVYPLSAPHFLRRPAAHRERPVDGASRLYVHIPFCRYACTFCFYAKRVTTQRTQMRRYVDGLRCELDALGGERTTLQQLYVGGGTPTALPPDLLGEVLAAVTAHMPLDHSAAHTVECSPESLTAEHVDVVRRHGIGRMSLGVQTLDERVLASIKREHSAQQALDACALLARCGLFVNVDLIYGFPGQSEDSVQRDLNAFAALGAQSFTVYNLRLNERTPLATALQDAERVDLARLMQWRRFFEQATAELGYRQTRWHTFLRHDCRDSGHDRAPGTNAFGSGRELGVGVSAYSHLGETIYRNHEGFEGYLRRVEAGESPVEEVFPFAPRDRQALYIARTLGDGRELDLAEYERIFNRAFEEDYGGVKDRLVAAELVLQTAGRLALTDLGRQVYDLVTLAFYPNDARQWLERRQRSRRWQDSSDEPRTVAESAEH